MQASVELQRWLRLSALLVMSCEPAAVGSLVEDGGSPQPCGACGSDAGPVDAGTPDAGSADGGLPATPHDTQAPSAPSGLTATATSSSQIVLNWTAATDNVGVLSHTVFRNGARLATVLSGTTYTDLGLLPSTTYAYTVSAEDAAGNAGERSPSASATTLATSPPVVPGAAFPGAQGGGAGTKGGRGGAVLEVTNLNDSGAGSLRACVDAVGPRTCVFRVSGTIQLVSTLDVTHPYLTVAGQTSPGGGVVLSGVNKRSGGLVNIDTHDVVWRYTRLRNGYNSACIGECGGDINVYGSTNIVDHNTVQWNIDEGIGSWGWSGADPSNITISYNLVAEGFDGHSTGFITGGANAAAQVNIDYHHNLAMNNSHRNPLLKNKSSRYVNNLHYNNRFYASQFLGMSADVIGNVYKKGPLMATHPGIFEIQVGPTTSDSPTGITPSIHVSGNRGWSQTDPAGDPWNLTRQVSGENGTQVGAVPSAWKRAAPMPSTAFPIVAEPAAGLEASTLPIVGASRRLDCNGLWVANRDTQETRLLAEYQSNSGISRIPTTEDDVGGYPSIAPGTACLDTDHDGMPDLWEVARGLNPNNAADRNLVTVNGFTNLEVYLGGQ